MKPNPLKIFAFIVCSIVFASAIHAQEKPKYSLIGKISNFDTKNFQIVEQKIEEFISRLIKEPSETKGYIDIPENTEIGKQIKAQIDKNADVKNRVSFWGTLKHPEYHRYSLGVGLYIIPLNAEIPAKCILETCVCPSLTIETSISKENNNSILIYELKASGGDIEDITYQWKISAGEIVEGQNTPVIKVTTKDVKEITATVELGGLCEGCERTASFTSKINGKLEMIDAFGLETECQYRGRMDDFMTLLTKNPAAKGFIINYGSRQGGKKSLAARNKLIIERLTLRNFEMNRIEFINGGYLEKPATELWISTDDNLKPVPTLVDENKVKTKAATIGTPSPRRHLP